MKRMISMLMILALLLGSVGTFAETLSDAEMEAAEVSESVESLEEEAQDVFELYGEIVEITDEYVLLSTADMGYVQVNLSDDTVIEGVEALELGQTAVVMYDGMMTRSLPPQINALHIGVYAVSGVIAEVLEDSIVIVQEETGEQIILTLSGSELLGENEELIEEEALAADEEAADEETVVDEEAIDEEAEAALTEEGEAAEALGEEADEALFEDEALVEDEQEFRVGDRIIAYTTGAMTMSLPPQMNALAIVLDLGDLGEEASAETEASETAETEEAEESIG